MAGTDRPLRLVDRWFLWGAAGVGYTMAAGFLAMRLDLIGIYLALAATAFGVFAVGYRTRHQRVLAEPPPGFEPTGERVPNPPGGEWLEVWHSGIRRVYVRAGAPPDERV